VINVTCNIRDWFESYATVFSSGGSVVDKSTAIRLLPGSDVLFRGRRHSVMSVKSGQQNEAPFFRLRASDDGAITGLISHRMVEPVPAESDLETVVGG